MLRERPLTLRPEAAFVDDPMLAYYIRSENPLTGWTIIWTKAGATSCESIEGLCLTQVATIPDGPFNGCIS